MLDRAKIVDENFTQRVRSGQLPEPMVQLTPQDAGLDAKSVLELFESQLISRHLDLESRRMKEANLSFYTIGSCGHEGNAAVARAFRVTDPAFLHYRSGAFVVERARQKPKIDIVYDLMLSFAASSDDPIAQGRHKVFGSVPLSIPPQTSTIASHLPKAVGAAFSIAKAAELDIKSNYAQDAVVLCSFGDASLNHSVSQGALNLAQWFVRSAYPLPLVMVCEDNGIGISVPTPQNWIKDTLSARKEFNTIPCNGLSLVDTYLAACEAEYLARIKREPVFLHVKTIRLLGHAGSDIEQVYRDIADIEATEANDPLLHSARLILDQGYLTAEEIIERYEAVRTRVRAASERAVKRPKLDTATKVMASIIPPARKNIAMKKIDAMQRERIFAEKFSHLTQPRNLCQMINLALIDTLLQYDNAVIFGEDVGRKGGVYNVTDGLQQRFSTRRVFDTLLDETSILGTAIGLAHNGFLPIPEIQFLAYVHNAEDQIRGEAATLSFFSSGQYTNPMVIRIAGLAYQKGFGGHYHNDNSFAVFRDIPGLIVACPSNGLDAVKLWRTCVHLAQIEQRVVIFLEPIALYMTKDLHEKGDNGWLCQYPALDETIPFGEVGVYGDPKAPLTIVTYGNGYYLARQAEEILRNEHKIRAKIIDLRWLVPLPEKSLLQALVGSKQVLIVDESRKSGSISEAIITAMIEKSSSLPVIKRITGQDSFISLGNSWQYLLPTRDDIVQTVLTMKGVKATV